MFIVLRAKTFSPAGPEAASLKWTLVVRLDRNTSATRPSLVSRSRGDRVLQGEADFGLTKLAPADLAALKGDALATALGTTVREAFRQGVGGYAQDMVAQARPWSFHPQAIVAPVWVLHGDADTLTPPAHAHHTAGLIPTARLKIRPDQGHMSILTEIPELAAALVAVLR